MGAELNTTPAVVGEACVESVMQLHRVALLIRWDPTPDEPPTRIAPLKQPMHSRITEVAVPAPCQVALAFTDGTRGMVDLSPWIDSKRGVFAALQDPALFAQVGVDADAGTIVWPNGADLDPDVLYEAAHGAEAGSRRTPER